MTQLLHFDPVEHEYRLHDEKTPASWGRRLLSVTQALQACNLVDDDWYTEQSRQRGRFVHKAVMLEEQGRLDESTIDERLLGYIGAYRAFKRDVPLGPCEWLEQPLADPVLGFAGTPDQVRPVRDVLTLLDLKSGAPHPTHALQTSGYVHLLTVHNPDWRFLPRAALYLRKNGAYQLVPHENRNDIKIFKAAVVVAQWKEKAA